MNLPEIGDILTTKEALELYRYFGLDYLIERIESAPEGYKDWKFDGCSGLPDKVMGFTRAVTARYVKVLAFYKGHHLQVLFLTGNY